MKHFECAICQRAVRFDGALPEQYPFCSDRCRMVDLGRWFREAYSIDRDVNPDDFDTRGPLDNPPDTHDIHDHSTTD